MGARKKWTWKQIIFFTAALVMFMVHQTSAEQASDAKLIKIMPRFEADKVTGFHVEPSALSIKKNTIIVWMNGVPSEIQVVFQEGKICRDVTADPNRQVTGFFLNAKRCYVTSFLPYSGTTALQFIETGTYSYEVITEAGDMQAKGKIIVID